MRWKQYVLLFTLLVGYRTSASAQINELERATPESQGVASASVTNFFTQLLAFPNTEIHSVMVLRHGKVIGEMFPKPFAAEYSHTLYSASKTFVAAAIGLAIQENRLRLTDRVATFFPNELPSKVSDNLANMTIRDLLTMQSGITPDWTMRNNRKDWITGWLAKSVSTPGKKFAYDSMSTYLLSAILQKEMGKSTLEYLKEKLFTKMNITKVNWEESPEGYNTGGWGLYLQSESLAKFGQLLLNNGVWNGEQLLPADWVKEMSKQQLTGSSTSYGYQMWIDETNGWSRADGALGQYIIVMPGTDMVVVITQCCMGKSTEERGLIGTYLLKDIQEEALEENEKAYKQLTKKSANSSLDYVEGKITAVNVTALQKKEITLGKNNLDWKSLKFDFLNGELNMLITKTDGSKYTVNAGFKEWKTIKTNITPPYSIGAIDRFKGIRKEFMVAASYAWKDKNTLGMRIHYANWVTSVRLLFTLDEKKNVTLHIKENYMDKSRKISCKIAQ
jgi:CubicO group peptidase (beta-lactamase class C family)